MEERAFHPLDYLSVVKRRKWWLIAPLAVGVVAGVLLALLWPKDYISQAKIGIAAPTLSPELLRGVSSLDKEERQRAISQQLLSRQVLERVAREEKLDPSKPVEDVAGWLRSRVVVQVDQPIGRMENKNGLDSFDLGYMDSEPDRAQRITNRLAYVFVEENSKTRTSRAENTSEVLGQQTQASLERLTQLEAQLRAKKEANMGRLPSQVNANTEMVRGLRQSLDSYSLQLRTEEDRLSQIEAQLEDMRRGTGSTAMTSSAASAVHTLQARKRSRRPTPNWRRSTRRATGMETSCRRTRYTASGWPIVRAPGCGSTRCAGNRRTPPGRSPITRAVSKRRRWSKKTSKRSRARSRWSVRATRT
jgi:polysaccharide biosynthesis transport protein